MTRTMTVHRVVCALLDMDPVRMEAILRACDRREQRVTPLVTEYVELAGSVLSLFTWGEVELPSGRVTMPRVLGKRLPRYHEKKREA